MINWKYDLPRLPVRKALSKKKYLAEVATRLARQVKDVENFRKAEAKQ